MLELTFVGLSAAFSHRCPPCRSYRFEGGILRDEGGAVIAVYDHGSWVAWGEFYTCLECRGSVVVRFEDPGQGTIEDCGAFQKVDVLDGLIAAVNGYLASLQDDNAWQCLRTGVSWPVVVLAAKD